MITAEPTGSAKAASISDDYGIEPAGGCALANLRAGVDPIGTATPFDELFLLQVAPPWPSIALKAAGVPAGLQQALAPAIQAGRTVYGLLIDADDVPPAPAGMLRFIHVRRPPGPARQLERKQYLVSLDEAAASFGSLALAEAPGSALEIEPPPARELLVCTHGSRDGCCGEFGEAAYRYLCDRYAGPDLQVWRASHFGGHRFAPTLIDLPDGRCWGWLTAARIDALVERREPVAELMPAYRGWCALPNEAQAAERDLFAEVGWAWQEAELQADLQAVESAGVIDARLSYRLPGGRPATRHAELQVIPAEAAAPASCGATPSGFSRYTCTWLDTDPTDELSG